ncbi:hypothetical protein ACFSUJ_21725 [Streptomyces lusitanus]|uniref:hypothetical protein n=1 Tax=Streptomyces lusitanus TaxID=68232 RepID=UPI00361F1E5F
MHVYNGDYVKADTEWEELCWIRERTDAPKGCWHGAPENGVYRVIDAGPFGEPIKLPAPFDLVIDTGEFPHS